MCKIPFGIKILRLENTFIDCTLNSYFKNKFNIKRTEKYMLKMHFKIVTVVYQNIRNVVNSNNEYLRIYSLEYNKNIFLGFRYCLFMYVYYYLRKHASIVFFFYTNYICK